MRVPKRRVFLLSKSMDKKNNDSSFPALELERSGRQGNTGVSLHELRRCGILCEWKIVWRKKNGKIVCTEVIETTGKPASIKFVVDNMQLSANNRDVAHVRVEVIDSKGNIVPTASNLIQYKIEGNGKLIGLDNGNPADLEPYISGKRKVFNGLGLAIVQFGKTSGKVSLTASSEGLESASVEISIPK